MGRIEEDRKRIIAAIRQRNLRRGMSVTELTNELGDMPRKRVATHLDSLVATGELEKVAQDDLPSDITDLPHNHAGADPRYFYRLA